MLAQHGGIAESAATDVESQRNHRVELKSRRGHTPGDCSQDRQSVRGVRIRLAEFIGLQLRLFRDWSKWGPSDGIIKP